MGLNGQGLHLLALYGNGGNFARKKPCFLSGGPASLRRACARQLQLGVSRSTSSSCRYLAAHGELVALSASDAELRGELLCCVGHRHFAEGVGEGLPERVLEREVVGELGAPASVAQAVAVDAAVRHAIATIAKGKQILTNS